MDRIEKSFEFTQESTKQLISLATLIIGFNITFFKDFIEKIPAYKSWFLLPWGILLISILTGIFALYNLSGTLGNTKEISIEEVSVYRRQIKIWLLSQLGSFFFGLFINVILLWLALK